VTDVHTRAATGTALGRNYIAATNTCLAEHLGEVGGKAVGLGSLLRSGQRVPASFVVTAAAHREYVGAGAQGLSAPVRDAIARSYSQLCELHGAELAVAVRSSASVEDSAEASWAGQFRTFLGACGVEELLEQVEQCWVAAGEPQVGSYRAERQLGVAGGGVAVIIQELVDARAAGVMFTQHPRTGDRSLVVIESSYGLGEAVVGGEVTPDLFEINKITGQAHYSRVGAKSREHRLDPGGRRVTTMPVDTARQQAWSISGEEVTALVRLAGDLEASLGRGLDVEWAIGSTASTQGAEALFSLQVRPITVDPGRRTHASPDTGAVDHVLGRLAGRRQGNGTG
jgi:pyruvate, water dikinase